MSTSTLDLLLYILLCAVTIAVAVASHYYIAGDRELCARAEKLAKEGEELK